MLTLKAINDIAILLGEHATHLQSELDYGLPIDVQQEHIDNIEVLLNELTTEAKLVGELKC